MSCGGGDIARFPGLGECAAFCGLDPSVRDSGDNIHGVSHISKRGSPLLRWALYMSAQTMVNKHRDFTKIYERHVNRHKRHRYAMIAVAHKLEKLIWRLVKDGRSFCKMTTQKVIAKIFVL